MSFKPYPAYKDSGVEWLGEIPEHWTRSKVNTGYQIQLGKMLQNNAQSPADIQISYLRAYNVAWEKIITDDIATMWASPREVEQYSIKVGDLLVCEGGEAGRCAILKEITSPTIIQNALHRVRPRKGFNNQYLLYLLMHCAATGWFDVLCNKATIVHFTVDKFSNLELPIAPLPEQQTIAAFLDHETTRIDALVAEQQTLIALLKEKRQAVISHAVTRGLDPNVPLKDSGVEWLGQVPEHWEITRLKYATQAIVDCPHETPSYSEEGEYLVIRTADVYEGILDTRAIYRVNEDEYLNRIRRLELSFEDIVYSREGERWGFAALVPDSNKFCLGQRMMQFKSGNSTNPSFLMWHLNAVCTYRQGQLDTVGSTSPHVNVSTIRNYWLASPPLHEQQDIASFINTEVAKMDTLITEAQRGIELLKERRSALISAAVTGQIDVRGWQPSEAVA